MKKKISINLIFFELIFPSKAFANYENFDFEKFMRNAQHIVRVEREYNVPNAIAYQFSQSLFIKNKYIDKIIENYNKSKNELIKQLNFANNLISKLEEQEKSIDLKGLYNYLEYSNELQQNDLSIKNSLYNYRKAEMELFDIKDNLKDYCSLAAKLENSNALTFEPQAFNLAELYFTPNTEETAPDILIHNDPDIRRNFFIMISSGGIAGAIVAGAASSTGLGAIVIAAVFAAAFIYAYFAGIFQKNKEKEEFNKFKRKVESKYNEAKEWYKNNSIIYKSDEIKKLAYEICSTDKELKYKESNKTDEINVNKILKETENRIAQKINEIKAINGGFIYNKNEIEKFLTIFSSNTGDFDIKYFEKYKDPITKSYHEYLKTYHTIDKKKIIIVKKLAEKYSQIQIQSIQNKIESDRKVIKIQNTIYNDIRDIKTRELFDIFISNRDNCEGFTELSDLLMKDINITIENTLEKNIDDFNKNNEFIVKKIPQILDVITRYNSYRKKLICGGN